MLCQIQGGPAARETLNAVYVIISMSQAQMSPGFRHMVNAGCSSPWVH